MDSNVRSSRASTRGFHDAALLGVVLRPGAIRRRNVNIVVTFQLLLCLDSAHAADTVSGPGERPLSAGLNALAKDKATRYFSNMNNTLSPYLFSSIRLPQRHLSFFF